MRVSQPFKDKVPGLDRSGWWTDYNSDKYSLALNMRHSKAIDVLKRLIVWCDVFIENFAPGVVEKWGVGYEQVKKLNPGLIMLSANMQGNTGPHAHHPGLGTNLAGLSGFYEVLGWPDRQPVYGYGAFTDFMAPSLGIAAICAALIKRRRTGKGEYIELSQLECGLQTLDPALLDYTVSGRVQSRMGNRHHSYAPYGIYRCQGEDRWCAIAVTNEGEWKNFCLAVGRPEWVSDQRFRTFPDRKKNEDELDRLIGEWTINFTPEIVMYTLQDKGVPAGVVRTPPELFDCPQLIHRKFLRYLNHPVMGRHVYQSYAFRLSKTPSRFEMPGPCLGEHTAYVCNELLGMSDEEFAALYAEGVFE
ncbi:MAG: CoA transferase [Pseudomonadota bacterium]